MKGEDRAEYESVLNGFWEALQPEGKLEEFLAEKLAITVWRQRRLLVAEGAEIRKGTEFVGWDQRNKEQEEATRMGTIPSLTLPKGPEDADGGLIEQIENPHVLEHCLELLFVFRQEIETYGLTGEWDDWILRKIYGHRRRFCLDLYDSCSAWFGTMKVPEEERKRKGYAAPKQCKQQVMGEIDAEIRRLEEYQKTRASIESDRTKLEVLRRSVPDPPGLIVYCDMKPAWSALSTAR